MERCQTANICYVIIFITPPRRNKRQVGISVERIEKVRAKKVVLTYYRIGCE